MKTASISVSSQTRKTCDKNYIKEETIVQGSEVLIIVKDQV